MMNTKGIDRLRRGAYDIVRLIPQGRASSYGAIAKAAGYPMMARLVGKLMGECEDKSIPAHRVVNSQGMLSGKEAFGQNGEMQKRLESEGIRVKEDRILNWKHIFWNPIDEIKMDRLSATQI